MQTLNTLESIGLITVLAFSAVGLLAACILFVYGTAKAYEIIKNGEFKKAVKKLIGRE